MSFEIFFSELQKHIAKKMESNAKVKGESHPERRRKTHL